MCCMYTVYSGMQEWVIQIPSIPILVSVLFPSLHLKYFRIKFLLLVRYKTICAGHVTRIPALALAPEMATFSDLPSLFSPTVAAARTLEEEEVRFSWYKTQLANKRMCNV